MMKLIFALLLLLSAPQVFAQLIDPRFLPVLPPQNASLGAEQDSDFVSAEEEGGYYIKRPGAKKVYYEEVESAPKANLNTKKTALKKNKNANRKLSNSEQKDAQQTNAEVNNNQDLAEDKNQNFGQKMQDILLGGDLEKIESERSLFEKNDVRKNLFDLSIGSFYFYNHSQSTYYYRNYLSASPGAFVNLDLWVTPYLGFNSNYKFTLLNSIKDSPTAETYTTANHDWLSFGLKFRRFFGSAFETTSFSIDLNYIDKKLDIPLSSTHRVKTRSRGPQVSFNLITPSSKYFLWDFAINIQPFVLHEEFVGTSDLRSGTNNQTLGFGASIGGEYRMSRKLRTFFKFSAELYRSQFSGNALATDPINSSIPSNVVINDAYYFFNIGLIFGR